LGGGLRRRFCGISDERLLARAVVDHVEMLLDLTRPMPAGDAIKFTGQLTAQLDQLRRQLERATQ
jgi:hypothetical protein